jgi:uncharacterized protein (DUF4415 family)
VYICQHNATAVQARPFSSGAPELDAYGRTERADNMKAEYDFSRGRRGAVRSTRGKTRITIYLDDRIVKAFKEGSERTGKDCQTLITEALAQHTGGAEKSITAAQFRKILREELARIRL